MKIAQDAAVEEAKQLVAFGKDGTVLVNEDVLGSCFLRDDVKDLPVCVISIIGEERKGKSFLLNYLLRRLSNLDCGGQEWMGGGDEDLCGFEWKPGSNATTKGVFIWSTPFLIKTQQGQMAVFVVDTEGCDGVGQDKGISVQLSALSMLLSSYLILNVSSKISQTDLDYLEMFVDTAQKVGEVLGLETIQQLDILVRDWFGTSICGDQAGKEHLEETQQKLRNSKTKYLPYMETLISKAQCFLMPFPGKKIALSTTGHANEMDEDFRECLVNYFSCVLRTLPSCSRTDNKDSVLTGSRLFDQIKLFTATIEKHSLQIRTPLQMTEAFWNMKLLKETLNEYKMYISEQERAAAGVFSSVKLTPRSMKRHVELKASELLADYQRRLRKRGVESKEDTLYLKMLMVSECQSFCSHYKNKFWWGVMKCGMMAGSGVIGAAGAVVGAVVAGPAIVGGAILAGALQGASVGTGLASHQSADGAAPAGNASDGNVQRKKRS